MCLSDVKSFFNQVSLLTRVDTGHRDMIVSLDFLPLVTEYVHSLSLHLLKIQHDAQTDFYGTKLATCSSDKSVKIFDVKPDGHQTFLAELLGFIHNKPVNLSGGVCKQACDFSHEGPVWQLSWSHPMYGSLLCSCSYDRRVIVWKESSGKWSKHYEYLNHDASGVYTIAHIFDLKHQDM